MNTEDILFNMVILGISRFLDLLSTWYCTPNFKMGVNPWMKTASWKTVILVNIILVIILPVVLQKRTIFLAVLFTLYALRNFQTGIISRAMGEEAYLDTYRQFLKNSPWYIPLLPIVFEVFVFTTMGLTIIFQIGKPQDLSQEYVKMIGAAFLTFGWIIGSMTIIERLEAKYSKHS